MNFWTWAHDNPWLLVGGVLGTIFMMTRFFLQVITKHYAHKEEIVSQFQNAVQNVQNADIPDDPDPDDTEEEEEEEEDQVRGPGPSVYDRIKALRGGK